MTKAKLSSPFWSTVADELRPPSWLTTEVLPFPPWVTSALRPEPFWNTSDWLSSPVWVTVAVAFLLS